MRLNATTLLGHIIAEDGTNFQQYAHIVAALFRAQAEIEDDYSEEIAEMQRCLKYQDAIFMPTTQEEAIRLCGRTEPLGGHNATPAALLDAYNAALNAILEAEGRPFWSTVTYEDGKTGTGRSEHKLYPSDQHGAILTVMVACEPISNGHFVANLVLPFLLASAF